MKLSLPSVALGAVLVAAPAVVIRIGVVGPVQIAGVPLARDMITITTPSGVSALGQSTIPIYSVPSNRWLVITGTSIVSSYVLLYETRGANKELRMNLSSNLLITGSGSGASAVYDGDSAFPISFRPGSVVEVSEANGNVPALTLTGYLE